MPYTVFQKSRHAARKITAVDYHERTMHNDYNLRMEGAVYNNTRIINDEIMRRLR